MGDRESTTEEGRARMPCRLRGRGPCDQEFGHEGPHDWEVDKESNRLATLRVLDLLRSPEMEERLAAVVFDLWTGRGGDDGMVPLAEWPKAIVDAVWSGLGEQ